MFECINININNMYIKNKLKIFIEFSRRSSQFGELNGYLCLFRI